MKNQSRYRQHPVLITALVLVISFILLLMLVFIYSKSSFISKDKQRFSTAIDNKNKLIDEVSGVLGEKTVYEEHNSCYDSEQSPYDKGTLWCRSETTMSFYKDDSRDEARLKETFIAAISKLGFEKSDKRLSKIEFYGAKNLPCTVEVMTQKSGNLLVDLSCADRAKAKHFEYVQ